MKRLLPVLLVMVGTLALVWCVFFAVATPRWASSAREEWPFGLGTLASVPLRYEAHGTTRSAERLKELAAPLGIRFVRDASRTPDSVRTAIGDFVRREHESADRTIGAPPAEFVRYLDLHAGEIDALRAHLLSGERIAWIYEPSRGLEAPLPNLVAHMHIARLLVARGLVRRDWEDLYAAWKLEQSLEQRPELISQLVALALARMINAAAWKMPVPPPAWLQEMQAVDHRRLLMAALQSDTWSVWRHGDDSLNGPIKYIAWPYIRFSLGSFVRHEHETAHQLAAMSGCALDGEAFFRRRMETIDRRDVFVRTAAPNLGSAWQRAFRYDAEREATANALRVMQGQPIVTKSRCSDGAWLFENGTLSFTRELPKAGRNEQAMPLVLDLSE